ncbi:MAG: hypothetical protein K1000chlam3_00113 [Chlamydiae bacterium]|nr:hypothetical protein [Chlamydiota bacterium]
MVVHIDLKGPISKVGFQGNFSSVQSQIALNVKDTIRFGKEEPSAFLKFTTKMKFFFHWVYIKARFLFSKIFSCFDSLKLKETILEKHQKNLKELDAYSHSFAERVKRETNQEFKSWWEKTFESLDPDIRKMLILEDIKTLAPENYSKKEAWAEENYSMRRVTSTKFVRNLEPVPYNGITYDPIDEDGVPAFIKNVKDKLREEIKELEKK